jgi:hypothetical protein
VTAQPVGSVSHRDSNPFSRSACLLSADFVTVITLSSVRLCESIIRVASFHHGSSQDPSISKQLEETRILERDLSRTPPKSNLHLAKHTQLAKTLSVVVHFVQISFSVLQGSSTVVRRLNHSRWIHVSFHGVPHGRIVQNVTSCRKGEGRPRRYLMRLECFQCGRS